MTCHFKTEGCTIFLRFLFGEDLMSFFAQVGSSALAQMDLEPFCCWRHSERRCHLNLECQIPFTDCLVEPFVGGVLVVAGYIPFLPPSWSHGPAENRRFFVR